MCFLLSCLDIMLFFMMAYNFSALWFRSIFISKNNTQEITISAQKIHETNIYCFTRKEYFFWNRWRQGCSQSFLRGQQNDPASVNLTKNTYLGVSYMKNDEYCSSQSIMYLSQPPPKYTPEYSKFSSQWRNQNRWKVLFLLLLCCSRRVITWNKFLCFRYISYILKIFTYIYIYTRLYEETGRWSIKWTDFYHSAEFIFGVYDADNRKSVEQLFVRILLGDNFRDIMSLCFGIKSMEVNFMNLHLNN